jgi:hypothetical protein
MSLPDTKTFLLKISRSNGIPTGYSVQTSPGQRTIGLDNNEQANIEQVLSKAETPFRNVLSNFQRSMAVYVGFIPVTLIVGPMLMVGSIQTRVVSFAEEHGKKREDLSSEREEIYELEIDSIMALRSILDDIRALNEGSKHVPTVMLIGLVSTYDSYLATLLEAVFKSTPETISSSEKVMTFSELCRFSSIGEARDSMIMKEIETIIRQNHHEQFKYMEKKFEMKLRENLAIWPKFIELCERRNLFTHTGGIVSKQYISAGEEHKFDIGSAKIGDILTVDSRYFNMAVEVIYEIGAKLGYVLWRKFDDKNANAADNVLNELCYGLIYKRHYNLAEKLLRFGTEEVKKRKGKDATRRSMVINLANACRLKGDKTKATKILDDEDWSAVDDRFHVCIAAVRENPKEVAALIRKIGANSSMNIHDYKEWPVFRGVDVDEQVRCALREVFGEEGSSDTGDKKTVLRFNLPDLSSLGPPHDFGGELG